MKIYLLGCDFMGCGLSAVVVADSEERAVELLRWVEDDDRADVTCIAVGESYASVEMVICEEAL